MKFSHLRRLYCPCALGTGAIVQLSKEHGHYLVNVLRMSAGSRFRIWNENCGEYLASLSVVNKVAAAEVAELLRKDEEVIDLYLAQCVVKSDRLARIFDAATQMGVTHIAPLVSSRSQYSNINISKMQKCVIEASEQSERLSIPHILNSEDLVEFLDRFQAGYTGFNIILCASENATDVISADLASKIRRNKVAILVGPEGGFTDEEFKYMESISGLHFISLGNRVLRSEVAAIALLAQVQYIFV